MLWLRPGHSIRRCTAGWGWPRSWPVSTRFKYALILTVSGVALHLVMFFTGLETVRLGVGHHLFWLNQVFMAVVLWLGIKAVRQQSPHQGLTYGRAVGAGVVISLYSALMSAGYDFIHFKWINPHFTDYQLACVKPEWAAAGKSAAEQDEQVRQLLFVMSPLPHAVIFTSITVIFGLILSLLIAAFLKHPAFAGTSPPLQSTPGHKV